MPVKPSVYKGYEHMYAKIHLYDKREEMALDKRRVKSGYNEERG